jgi:CRISPR-associated protein Csm1
MDSTVLKLSLAGLLHDIGKFAQTGLEVTPEYRNSNAGEYQPFDQEKGYHTHQHALYTAAFIEQLADLLPPLFNLGEWGEGDSFINLAAGHHLPRTPLQWIVAMADRISSGFDRDSFEQGAGIAPAQFLKTRLLPLLESLTIDPEKQRKFTAADNFHYRYPLARLAPETIFPEVSGELQGAEAKQSYQRLFNDFCHELESLPHRQESLELWGRHLDSLLLLYTSLIPAARAGDVVYDVSLYDHCRTTAALAAALYLYHRENGTLEERAIRDNQPEKFLLISGDFYGIQDFIFAAGGASGRYRAKLLRGRSFQVSLLTELAAEKLCRALDLPETAVLLNAAGKFTILAPNTPQAASSAAEAEKEISDWLFAVSFGQCGIGFSRVAAAPADFTGEKFSLLWDKLSDQVAEKKLERIDLDRYGGVVDGYLESFDSELGICDLCGRRPAMAVAGRDRLMSENSTRACPICRDQVFLGGSLVKNDYLAVLTGEVPESKSQEKLLQPLFGEFQVVFPENQMVENAARGELVSYWNLGAAVYRGNRLDASLRFFKGYVPTRNDEDGGKRSQVMDFAEIADFALASDAAGTAALGVLKADIDNLGLLLSCGLPEKRFTISRLATLSRQLNNFFTIFLPSYLDREPPFRGIYTIFAGGDDLFLVGPWNRIIDLAAELRGQFSRYVCKNSDLHFSLGISIQKPHVPVDRLAHCAEEALAAAKQQDKQEKNRITVFGETVSWPVFDRLETIGQRLKAWLDNGYLNQALLYRLGRLSLEAAFAKVSIESLKRMEEVDSASLDVLKWRSRLCYTLERNAGRDLPEAERKMARQELVVLGEWLEEYDRACKIPIWRILYDLR